MGFILVTLIRKFIYALLVVMLNNHSFLVILLLLIMNIIIIYLIKKFDPYNIKLRNNVFLLIEVLFTLKYLFCLVLTLKERLSENT